jgi:hypothetical protein
VADKEGGEYKERCAQILEKGVTGDIDLFESNFGLA